MQKRLKKEERKKQIREKALSLFLENSLSRTTMNDIALACGISKSAVYYHYENTDEILLDIFIKDAVISRNNNMERDISKINERDIKEIFVDMAIQKIFDENVFKEVFSMILIESKRNERFKDLYYKIYLRSLDEFKKFVREKNFESYTLFDFSAFNFFVSSFYLGIFFIPDYKENKENIIKMARIFIKSYIFDENKNRKEIK